MALVLMIIIIPSDHGSRFQTSTPSVLGKYTIVESNGLSSLVAPLMPRPESCLETFSDWDGTYRTNSAIEKAPIGIVDLDLISFPPPTSPSSPQPLFAPPLANKPIQMPSISVANTYFPDNQKVISGSHIPKAETRRSASPQRNQKTLAER